MNTIKTIDEAIEKLYELSVGVIGTGKERHERPHKPLMLLAALDILASGHAKPSRVPWSPKLRETFSGYFEVVKSHNDGNTPENPFYYLRKDDFWKPYEIENGMERPLSTTPTAAQAKKGNVFARIEMGMEHFVRTPEQRGKLRDALISRYFPAARSGLTPLFSENKSENTEADGSGGRTKEESDENIPGRNPAFRRVVLEVYDFQCAACGLRIKLPDADLTFVDGAHIMPFSEGRNDHPTNGLALCKNHHWAMDRFLLAC